jgi:hypothetical protein
MIKKLTKSQEAQIPQHIKKWVDKASTPMNHKQAITATKAIYRAMGEEEPVVIFGLSPFNTTLLCALFYTLTKEKKKDFRSQLYSQLHSQLDSQLHSQLHSQLYSQLDSQLYSQLYSQLHSQLDSQLDSQLYSQLDSQLYSQLHSQLYSQLHSQLDSQLHSQLHSQLYSQLDPQLHSQLDPQLYSQLDPQLDSQLEKINKDWYLGVWWLSWCGWYEYAKMVGVKFDEGNYNLFMDFNSEVNFIISYKGISFISEKPKKVHWKNNSLHNEKGKAVEYPDGYGIYCLNGVRVPEEIVTTSAEKIDPQIMLKEKNAEVRREIVRKIGIERICQKLGAECIDKQDDYELLLLDLQDGRKRPYLKMLNPSIGTYHIEGVSPEIRTVEQALNWRNGIEGKPIKLT